LGIAMSKCIIIIRRGRSIYIYMLFARGYIFLRRFCWFECILKLEAASVVLVRKGDPGICFFFFLQTVNMYGVQFEDENAEQKLA